MSDASAPLECAYSASHNLSLDLHRSARSSTDPLVLYMHGGGFARGDKRDDMPRILALVRLGLNVASVNYRLAPEARFPDPVDDVREAVKYLRMRGEALGIRTDSIGLVGASAGGYLASMAAIDHGGDPATSIQAVSAWFSAADLVESTRRSPLERRISPVLFEANLFGGDFDEDLLISASPARADLRHAPPFLLVHGDSDKIVPASQPAMLHEALVRHGRDSTLVRLGRAGHEDPAFDAGAVPAIVAAWLRSHLSAAPSAATSEGEPGSVC